MSAGAGERLWLSGIDEDIDDSGRYASSGHAAR